MKKFAYILMGASFDPDKHTAEFDIGSMKIYIYTVRSVAEAKEKMVGLWHEGFGAIELCGAFGRSLAAEFTLLTQNKVAIGYVTHEPEQDELFARFFGKK